MIAPWGGRRLASISTPSPTLIQSAPFCAVTRMRTGCSSRSMPSISATRMISRAPVRPMGSRASTQPETVSTSATGSEGAQSQSVRSFITANPPASTASATASGAKVLRRRVIAAATSPTASMVAAKAEGSAGAAK
jgi:hypothetical protein